MIENYHRLQKQKKDLKKRNLKAQTDIAQYMRKHGMEIIHAHPLDFDRSQASLREEYNHLLTKVRISQLSMRSRMLLQQQRTKLPRAF